MGMTPQPVVRRRPGRVWRKREVSFMDFDFNKIKEMGLEYAEKGKNAAKDLAEKGKTQALIVNEQGKIRNKQQVKKRSIFPTRLDQDDPGSYSQYSRMDSIREGKMAAEQ